MPAADETGEELRATIADSSFSLAGYLTSAACGFAVSVIVARGLGATGAGAVFISIAISTVLMYLTVFGADTGLLRTLITKRALGRADELAAHLRAGLLPVGIVSTAVAIVLFAAAGPVARLLFGDSGGDGAALVRIVAVCLPAMSLAFAILHGATRGFGSLRPLVWCWQVGLGVLRVAAVALAVLVFGSPAWTFACWALPVIPIALVAWWLLRRQLRHAERQAGVAPHQRLQVAGATRSFWSFAAPRGAASTFDVGIVWLDVILLGIMRTVAEAGVYAALSRFITTGTLAMQAGRVAISGQVAEAFARGDLAAVQRHYRRAAVLVTLASWPLYLSLAIFSGEILTVFGSEFSDGATALTIVALASLYSTAAGNVSVVLLMGGRSSWTAINAAIALTLNIVLNLVLIPRYGIDGAAIAWSVSTCTDTSLALYQVRRRMRIRGPGRELLIVVVCAGSVFGLGGLLGDALVPDRLAAVLATLVLLSLVYVLLVSLLRRPIFELSAP